MSDVIFGPKIDLHDGIHGTILQNPPADIRYSVRHATHLFQFLRPGLASPHRDFHLGDFVDFGPGPELVHSSFWPVIHRRAWVADMDDFGYPVLGGRALLNPDIRQNFRRGDREGLQHQIKQRMANMLTMYAHPSCKGIVFCTQYARNVATRILHRLEAGALGEAFLNKAVVLYPAQRACSREKVRQKWSRLDTLKVVFCGCDYEAKNGALALRIFQRLAAEMSGVQFVYIGQIPLSSHHHQLPSNLDVVGTIPRDKVLEILDASHIFFHPSKFESVGIVLLEAAAAGMAVITSEGREMAHTGEFFGDGGAILMDRTEVPTEREETWFGTRLRTLLRSPAVAARMGFRNHEFSMKGQFSLAHRNSELAKLYDEGAGSMIEPINLGALPHLSTSKLVSLESKQIRDDETIFRREIGMDRQHLNFLI